MWLNENISYKFPSKMIKINPRIPSDVNIQALQALQARIWLAICVSLIIDQPECLVCYFLCTELTLVCIELPENCIYLYQSELSNFFMYITRNKKAGGIFFKDHKLHSPYGLMQFCFLWKSYSCLFIPNCTRNLVITYTNKGCQF